MTTVNDPTAPKTRGLVLHSHARYYDLLAGLLMWGHRRQYTDRLLALASLQPGDNVLDVGCGTGTLAIAAKSRVGEAGSVHGIDASAEMIARAAGKARKARVDVDFRIAAVESLPFSDAHFDAVFSTLMLHHLPRPTRERCAAEIRRVLKPGGKVLAVDFEPPPGKQRGLLSRFHRHGHVPVDEVIRILRQAGFDVLRSGAVGTGGVHFTLASRTA